MALWRSLQAIRSLCRTAEIEIREPSYLYGWARSYYAASHGVEASSWNASCFCERYDAVPCARGNTSVLRSTMVAEVLLFPKDKRFVAVQAKAPPQQRKAGAVKVAMFSPGFVYEPYAPKEPISFWRRWFTRDGWRRTKQDIIMEMKNAYAIVKLRKTGYSKQKFYQESVDLYKGINNLLANGEKSLLRKAVTERMYSELKNEIKQRNAMWSSIYWELVEPITSIRTLRARLIGVDPKDLNKVFIQLTLEFVSKQKFEAYDSKGAIAAGDKNKEIPVREVWVFEKSLFHPGAYWRLCGRLKV